MWLTFLSALIKRMRFRKKGSINGNVIDMQLKVKCVDSVTLASSNWIAKNSAQFCSVYHCLDKQFLPPLTLVIGHANVGLHSFIMQKLHHFLIMIEIINLGGNTFCYSGFKMVCPLCSLIPHFLPPFSVRQAAIPPWRCRRGQAAGARKREIGQRGGAQVRRAAGRKNQLGKRGRGVVPWRRWWTPATPPALEEPSAAGRSSSLQQGDLGHQTFEKNWRRKA